jgi:hypothetical protein
MSHSRVRRRKCLKNAVKIQIVHCNSFQVLMNLTILHRHESQKSWLIDVDDGPVVFALFTVNEEATTVACNLELLPTRITSYESPSIFYIREWKWARYECDAELQIFAAKREICPHYRQPKAIPPWISYLYAHGTLRVRCAPCTVSRTSLPHAFHVITPRRAICAFVRRHC